MNKQASRLESILRDFRMNTLEAVMGAKITDEEILQKAETRLRSLFLEVIGQDLFEMRHDAELVNRYKAELRERINDL